MITEAERRRVSEAVKAAEASISAEIVPCVFAQSSPYPESVWAGAAAAAVTACSALILLDALEPLWMPLWKQLLAIPAAGLAGAALGGWCQPVKRWLIGPERLQEAAARKAKEVFFDRGVSRTKGRDGVLVFVSLLERRAVILPDEAVRAKVPPERWRPALDALRAAAADGRPGEGLAQAVAKVAETLRQAGFTGTGQDNELPDAPIEGGR